MFIYIHLLNMNLILCEVKIKSHCKLWLNLTDLHMVMHECVCIQTCVCVMTFPQRARARFINHKHELMDPITLWRYVCLLSSVKSKERQEGETDTCTQAFPSVWTLTLKYPYHSQIIIVSTLIPSLFFLLYVMMDLESKCYLNIVVFTTNGLIGKNQRNLEVLVWGNVLLNNFPKKWLEFLVLNMPKEQNRGMTKRCFSFYSLLISFSYSLPLFRFFWV